MTGGDDEPVVPDHEIRDELPADLDAVGFVGVYQFPPNQRRRIPAVAYLVLGLVAVALRLARGADAVLVNDGLAWAGVALIAFGLYGLAASRPSNVDEQQALEAATAGVGFAVGHASAQMAWRGVWSRPTWRILLYSADDPPSRRGLVLVDAVDGDVVAQFTEENPEDWA